jgi:uncharacterized membrane protein
MDYVHLHLLLNHAPIMGFFIGLFFMVYGYIVKSEATRYGALWLFLILTPVSMLVSHSGEESEETVEDLPGVSEALMEEHEDAAGLAVVGTWILGAISLAGIVTKKRKPEISKWLVTGAMVAAIYCAATMAYAGFLGGQIRHTEVRAGNAAGQVDQGGTERGGEEEDDD